MKIIRKTLLLLILLFTEKYYYAMELENLNLKAGTKNSKNRNHSNSMPNMHKKNDIIVAAQLPKIQKEKRINKDELLIEIPKKKKKDKLYENEKNELFDDSQNSNKRIARKLIRKATEIYHQEKLMRYLSLPENNETTTIKINSEYNRYIEIIKLLIKSEKIMNLTNNNPTSLMSEILNQHINAVKLSKTKNIYSRPIRSILFTKNIITKDEKNKNEAAGIQDEIWPIIIKDTYKDKEEEI